MIFLQSIYRIYDISFSIKSQDQILLLLPVLPFPLDVLKPRPEINNQPPPPLFPLLYSDLHLMLIVLKALEDGHGTIAEWLKIY